MRVFPVSTRFCFRTALWAFLPFLLMACGSDDSKKDAAAPAGKRISVMAAAYKPKVAPDAGEFKIALPEPAANRDWSQNGGAVDHAPGHLSFSKIPSEVWSSSIGSGSGKSFKLLATPIVGGNAVYAMDSIGRVSAFNLANGERYWRVNTAPPSADGDAIGGGIAMDSNVLYASTGFGEVLALRAADGSVLWRRMLGKPIRAAPTVSEGRVFVLTIENETYALDARTGQVMWRHSGIAENAALMGASSPAVHGDTLVVAYSSGELFGLRTQNGRVIWSEVLAVPVQKGALPAIADIRGLPVIDKGRVFAISHSGRMVAIDERSGGRVWEADIGGMNTPCAVGNAVFVLSNDNELMALARDNGRIIWIAELQKLSQPSDRDSKPVLWSGPVLAGGRLWLTNSLGALAAYDPETGYALYDKEVADPFFSPPVVANRMMLLLSDDGTLKAFKEGRLLSD